MPSIFAIWSDDGRVDYGPTRPKLPHARRFGVATVAFAVAGLGIWSAYSAMIGNPKVGDNAEVRDPAGGYSAGHDAASENSQVANAVATSTIGMDSSTARSARTKRRVQPKTIGLVPIGASEGLTTAEPRLAAGTTPNPEVAFADRSVRAAAESTDRGAPKLAENSSDTKLRVAKKKPTHRVSPVQAYELADGRQVTVRRSARSDNRPAAVTDFDRRDSNFANAPPFGRRVRVAWPWFFEPF